MTQHLTYSERCEIGRRDGSCGSAADRRRFQRGRDSLRLAGELAAVDPLGAVLDAIAEPAPFTWDNPTGVIR